MTPFEFGWLVGILEGEGSFHMHKDNRPYINGNHRIRVVIEVKQKSQQILRKLVRLIPGGHIIGPIRYGTHEIFAFRLHDRRAIELARIVNPYLSTKRQGEVTKILEAITSAPPPNRTFKYLTEELANLERVIPECNFSVDS